MNHRPRVIPVLLLGARGLVKSIRFADHRYIGDVLNAARIFSDLEADELVLLDIEATRQGRSIDPAVVRRVADEITMPLAVGGGLANIDQITEVITSGAEKVVLSTWAWRDPYLIKESSDRFGASAVSVCVDARSANGGGLSACVLNGETDTGLTPVEMAKLAEEHGAGEILLQSVDRDGTREGYDVELTASVTREVSIPVVALGGARSMSDLARIVEEGGASAAAAASMFVYHGAHNGVLINYPRATGEVHS